MRRREFLSALGATTAGITLAGTHAAVFAQAAAAKPAPGQYALEQPPLPWKIRNGGRVRDIDKGV